MPPLSMTTSKTCTPGNAGFPSQRPSPQWSNPTPATSSQGLPPEPGKTQFAPTGVGMAVQVSSRSDKWPWVVVDTKRPSGPSGAIWVTLAGAVIRRNLPLRPIHRELPA